MEDHGSPLTWSCFYPDEGVEEFRHYFFYTTELEATILSAKEELTRREFEMLHLKDLLSGAIKERNEAQAQCQKLILDNLGLQQQLLQEQKQHQLQHDHNYNCHYQQQQQQEEVQQPKQESTPLSGTCSSEDESKAGDMKNRVNSPDSNNFNAPTQFSTDPIQQQLTSESEIPEAILKLAAEKPLPEKGKLLQAVKDAGPLLQTLLLAGPLPQWQHPPPQLESIDIPPVTISSPTARPIRLDSLHSFNACLSKKRDLELCDGPDSSSPNKHQKVVLH